MTDRDSTTDVTVLVDEIAQLSDEDAVTALALIARRRGHSLDATTLTAADARVRQALTQPDVEPVLADVDPTAGTGDVARTALTALAGDSAAHDDITRAMALTSRGGERMDPATLAVGALVLFVFHADIDLRRDPDTGWHFQFKTKALSESTIGKVLGQLFGAYTTND